MCDSGKSQAIPPRQKTLAVAPANDYVCGGLAIVIPLPAFPSWRVVREP
jgi:hypothetical protein